MHAKVREAASLKIAFGCGKFFWAQSVERASSSKVGIR